MSFPAGPDDLTGDWLGDVLSGVPAFRQVTLKAIQSTVIGEGFGLDGTVARLELEVEGAGRRCPRCIVAKFAKAERGRSEISFYENLAPRMPVRLAEFFAGRVDEEGDRAVLLLEHVAPADQGDAIRGATLEQARALAGVMARFHAAFHGDQDPAFARLTAWSSRSDSIAGKVFERRERFLRRHGPGLTPRELACVESLPALLEEAEAELAGVTPTLVHGDLHLDNVLFPTPDDPVILDWPDARRGPAVMDFVRLLVEGITVEFRRRRQREVMEAYETARAAAGRPLPSAGRWMRRVRAAVIWHLAYAVAWAGAEDPGYGPPRIREIVHSLVRNTTAAAEDHV